MKKKIMTVLLILVALVIFLFFNEARNTYSYKGKMDLATEYPPPGEKAATESIIGSLKTLLEKNYPPPKRTLRDAHPKQHGLVKAEFTILDNIAEEYKVGIFKEPKTYKAWIRYSNLNGGAPDIKKDSRGMAIKLMGVEGTKLLPEQLNETTQDFVFMSTQFFVTKDVEGFAQLLTAINSGTVKTVSYFLTHPRLLMLFLKVRSQSPSLFDINWGSTTPYLFGDRAVKYAVHPKTPTGQTLPTGTPPVDYLRERMAATLKKDSIELDFFVQVQVDAKKMPIEDPRVTWDPKLSPFVKVATVKVLQQEFDTPEQQMYGDQLSFTPWHSLPEHRPMGGINRGRKAIYDTMSKFRHTRNGEVSKEPTDWSPY
ncbi:MAG: catalase family protein [Saprospiraceae bacterium]|nr:catalase family protein [Bacteroidia bacterium]NNE16240.1 catalase family protein [Saprospiraceae bacterium]NNL92731.1 catalase family protein [Saprospiraceae bacterium]